MSVEAAKALIKSSQERERAVLELGEDHEALVKAITKYKEQWKKAISSGWRKEDFVKAGWITPEKLPTPRAPKKDTPKTTTPTPVPAQAGAPQTQTHPSQHQS